MSDTTETPVLVDLANGQEAAALDHIERALDVLDEAEDFLIEEQRRDAVPSTSNQHAMVRYAEARSLLEDAFERLSGEPRIKVISSDATHVTTIRGGHVWPLRNPGVLLDGNHPSGDAQCRPIPRARRKN